MVVQKVMDLTTECNGRNAIVRITSCRNIDQELHKVYQL
jgi:hypothetical protein